jgi:hypothetical protein
MTCLFSIKLSDKGGDKMIGRKWLVGENAGIAPIFAVSFGLKKKYFLRFNE